MKLRSIAIVLTVTLASAAAHAQSGVFLSMEAQQFDQYGIYANPNNTISGVHSNVDRPWVFGPAFGVYYDVTHLPRLGALHTGPVVFGIDARGDFLRVSEYGSTLNREDGIVAIRVATKKKKFKGSTPYVYGGFGIGHTKIPNALHYSNNLVYQFGIGFDHQFHSGIDWRIAEASFGFLGSYTAGNSNTGTIYNNGALCAGVPCVSNPYSNNSNYLVTVGTGVVFHFR